MSKLPLPPGTPGLPVIGESAKLTSARFLPWVQQHYARFGPVWHTRMLLPTRVPQSFEIAMLVGPAAHRWAMVEHWRDLSWHTGYEFLNPFFESGILNSDEEEHAAAVKAVAPVFNSNYTEVYLRTVLSLCEQQLALWGTQGTRLLRDDLRLITLGSIERILFETDMEENQQRQFNTLWMTFIAGLAQMPWQRTYRQALRAKRAIDQILAALIVHEQTLLSQGQPRTNVIASLLRAREYGAYRLTDAGVMSHIRMLAFAGHETTSSTLEWLIVYLARDPALQSQVRVATNAFLRYATPRHQDLASSLVDAVIMEVMRLHPMFLMLRGVTKDLEFNGYRIPQGWMVMLSPFAAHRLPEVFPEPEHFDHTRFLAPQQVPPYAMIAFGEGKRSCPGSHLAWTMIKLVLAKILQFYDLTLDPATSLTYSSDPPPVAYQSRA